MKTSALAAGRDEMKGIAASACDNPCRGSRRIQAVRESGFAVTGQQGVVAAKRWYVARTQPHAERRAAVNLERQGFLIFCPQLRKSRRHARRLESVLVPLFPSYIFVQLDLMRDRWRCVRGTRGVAHIIMDGEMPLAVTPGIVESFQRRTCTDGTIDVTADLEVGQSVRVTHGPFTDLIGTLEQLDSAGRVRVLLDVLGRSVSVALNGKVLLPAG